MTLGSPDTAQIRPPAVIVGLGSVTGLQTARLLASRGIPVIGMAGDRSHFAARTRVCTRVVEADVQGPGLLAALLALGAELRPAPAQRPVLVPCTDHAVLVISEHRDELADHYRVVLPDDGLVRSLVDKVGFHEHAVGRGLPVPETVLLREPSDLAVAGRRLSYPVVLKPAFKSRDWKRATGVKAIVLDSPAELDNAWAWLSPHADTLVVQDFVPGGDDHLYTCNVYYGSCGTALVTFTTRKLRQWPPRIGTSSYGEECREDSVVALTRRLFDNTGFRGLGYLEVKCDPRTGRWHLIEANIGRPTGRSATAEAGGVELLLTMYCDAVGLPLPEARSQTYRGAVWVDLRRDALSAFHHWRKGELGILRWLRSVCRPVTHAVWSWRDPVPAVFEVTQSLGHVAARRLGIRSGQQRGAG